MLILYLLKLLVTHSFILNVKIRCLISLVPVFQSTPVNPFFLEELLGIAISNNITLSVLFVERVKLLPINFPIFFEIRFHHESVGIISK